MAHIKLYIQLRRYELFIHNKKLMQIFMSIELKLNILKEMNKEKKTCS